MKKLQKNDPYIRNIHDRLENNEDIKRRFVLRDDIVHKVVLDRFKIIISEEMLSEFITEMHTIYGQIRARKIYNMITEHLFAPRLRRKISSVLKTCETCQKTKYLTLKLNEQVQPILTNAPNELLSIDFFGPLPTSVGGVKHLLTTIDAFSKYVVVYPIKIGKPKGILSDHGTQFTSEKWIKALENEGIKPIFSSIRHSQSNLVERVHRELSRFFRTFVKERHTGWAKYLDVIQKIINETHHETTSFTPIKLHLNKTAANCFSRMLSHRELIKYIK